MFADLVNRLSGRAEVIKGIHRGQTNASSIAANFLKVMGFFKEVSRFNARYLWSQSDMMQGNEKIIWGFLDDIWYWSQNKISPNDPGNKPVPKAVRKSKSPDTRNMLGTSPSI